MEDSAGYLDAHTWAEQMPGENFFFRFLHNLDEPPADIDFQNSASCRPGLGGVVGSQPGGDSTQYLPGRPCSRRGGKGEGGMREGFHSWH